MEKEEIKRLIQEVLDDYMVGQFNILPGAIRQRHVGEGVKYLQKGLAADLPSEGSLIGEVYFEYDTPALKVWDGDNWQTI